MNRPCCLRGSDFVGTGRCTHGEVHEPQRTVTNAKLGICVPYRAQAKHQDRSINCQEDKCTSQNMIQRALRSKDPFSGS